MRVRWERGKEGEKCSRASQGKNNIISKFILIYISMLLHRSCPLNHRYRLLALENSICWLVHSQLSHSDEKQLVKIKFTRSYVALNSNQMQKKMKINYASTTNEWAGALFDNIQVLIKNKHIHFLFFASTDQHLPENQIAKVLDYVNVSARQTSFWTPVAMIIFFLFSLSLAPPILVIRTHHYG